MAEPKWQIVLQAENADDVHRRAFNEVIEQMEGGVRLEENGNDLALLVTTNEDGLFVAGFCAGYINGWRASRDAILSQPRGKLEP